MANVSRSSFAFRCQGKTDMQVCKAHHLYVLKGRWIRLPYVLLASKWIHLADPFLALPRRDDELFLSEDF